MGSPAVLELRNIFHSGQVEETSLLQRLFGHVETGLILKDISLEAKAGEVLAVLGSKGSGKRALLDVISRRAHGGTRGQILFDGQPLTLNLFQQTSGYVTHRVDLIPSLTTEQTLYYSANLSSGEKVSRYTCSTRVRQMLADLALNQVAHYSVSSLNVSQMRRLVIGVQLIKEPILLLLDEPTAQLDPLSTYLVVSILSSYARRRGRAVVLTMEKPRSDVFPFLDRAVFLCLGDILYTGPTRLMLDYFTSIGFPCPSMENPLMYYLCLSTVDRRSRERFLESNNQIMELIEKFKVEGGPYAASGQGISAPLHQLVIEKPSAFQVSIILYQRLLASTFNITVFGFVQMFLRLALFPLYGLFIFLVFFNTQNWEHSAINKFGLTLLSLTAAYSASIISTSHTFVHFRTRYYQESQEDLYSGPLFILCYLLFSLPFSLATVAAASRTIFQVSGLSGSNEWAVLGGVLWAAYLVGEYQTISIMMVVNSPIIASLTSFYITLITVILSSGILRSFGGLPDWLLYTSYGSQPHYASATLSSLLMGDPLSNCTEPILGCKYSDNSLYFVQRYNSPYNLWLTLGFPPMLILANCLLYIMPLPAFIKAKFRD